MHVWNTFLLRRDNTAAYYSVLNSLWFFLAVVGPLQSGGSSCGGFSGCASRRKVRIRRPRQELDVLSLRCSDAWIIFLHIAWDHQINIVQSISPKLIQNFLKRTAFDNYMKEVLPSSSICLKALLSTSSGESISTCTGKSDLWLAMQASEKELNELRTTSLSGDKKGSEERSIHSFWILLLWYMSFILAAFFFGVRLPPHFCICSTLLGKMGSISFPSRGE